MKVIKTIKRSMKLTKIMKRSMGRIKAIKEPAKMVKPIELHLPKKPPKCSIRSLRNMVLNTRRELRGQTKRKVRGA